MVDKPAPVTDAQKVKTIVDRYFKEWEKTLLEQKLAEERVITPEIERQVTQRVKEELAEGKTQVSRALQGKEKPYLEYVAAANKFNVAEYNYKKEAKPLAPGSSPMGDIFKKVTENFQASLDYRTEKFPKPLEAVGNARKKARAALEASLDKRKLDPGVEAEADGVTLVFPGAVLTDIINSANDEAYRLSQEEIKKGIGDKQKSPTGPAKPKPDSPMGKALQRFEETIGQPGELTTIPNKPATRGIGGLGSALTT